MHSIRSMLLMTKFLIGKKGVILRNKEPQNYGSLCLFDLIFKSQSTIFIYVEIGLPGLSQH